LKKYLCIHGHFYQPPRENPWLDMIEVQDSATPYHDWNERINRECYAPNAVARILTPGGRIVNMTNNFERISFNIGPTLFSWLKKNDPATYGKIVDADKFSRWKRNGHGSAMAQAYNHMIMPLASDRDKVTQILWGIADFVSHFGRRPEGMWLPETAVDKYTLKILCDNGIKFTILAPRQAKTIRTKPGGEWHGLGNGIDPTRAYHHPVDNTRSIAVFFYDGPISQAVAFEGILGDGARFLDRLKTGYSDTRPWNQLLHIATDGETYGHHHRFGEMALAFAMELAEKSGEIELTNYAEYLALYPPDVEADIHENSSWSCAHGVERWRSDCGCNIGGNPGWNQKWRTPLRHALDILKMELDDAFANEGGKLFADPWAVRDDYIEVILDRSKTEEFIARHQRTGLSREEKTRAVKLLEMQRNGMLMFTSCGWFFDDVSGIETQQVLKYAARAIQLCEETSSARPEKEFLSALTEAKSNAPHQGDAEKIYCRVAMPEKASLSRVMANHAMVSALDKNGGGGAIGSFSITERDRTNEEYGDNSLTLSRAEVISCVTMERMSFIVASLRLGGADVTCFVKQDGEELVFGRAMAELFTAWRTKPMTEVIRKLDDHFDRGETFMLRDLFMEQRRRTVGSLMAGHVRRFSDMYGQLFHENRRLLDYFIDANVPIPRELRLAAQYMLESEMNQAAEGIWESESLDRIGGLMLDMERWELDVDMKAARRIAETELARKLVQIIATQSLADAPALVRSLLGLSSAGFGMDLWILQNIFSEAYFSSQNTPGDPFFGARELKKVGILLNFSYKEQ
jgi:alpha-amylase/alpha-mannosidase (GH57 family)